MSGFWKSGRVRFAAAGALALTVGVLASLGAVGYAARIVGASDTTPVAAQYQPSKVTICHHTHSKTNPFVTITVSERALPAHLRHGDTIGPCPAQSSAPAAKVAIPSAKKQKPKHPGKQQGGKSHAKGHQGSAESSAKPNQGQGQTADQGQGQATAQGQGKGQGQGQGQGHANGHAKEHSQGGAQTQGQGSGNGNGNGHGSGNDHGNSGGGNGKKNGK